MSELGFQILDFKLRRFGFRLLVIVAAVSIPQLRGTEADLGAVGQGGDIPMEQSQGISLFSRNPLHLCIAIDGGYDTNGNTTRQQSQASAFTERQATLAGTVVTNVPM